MFANQRDMLYAAAWANTRMSNNAVRMLRVMDLGAFWSRIKLPKFCLGSAYPLMYKRLDLDIKVKDG